MIKRIREALAKRAKERDERDYQRGFGWAMSAFFVELMPIKEIEYYTIGHDAPFDMGAREAIRLINTRLGGSYD